MLTFKDALKKVESSEEVKALKAERGLFLSSGFSVMDSDGKNVHPWSINYYDSKTRHVTSFRVEGSVKQSGSGPIARTDDVRPIDPKKVKITATQALGFAKKKFEGDASRVLATIHNNGTEKEVWEITFITRTLSAARYEIDAATGSTKHLGTTQLMRLK